ncbi:MAG: zinc ribbon domain-containing protein [Treponemataceae bacterium]|nr:MAG: zinc ribbon domain-containing protein [Treponemataceae bacterium]
MTPRYEKSAAAKFFCEYCGAEVSSNAKICKKCGKFFLSVRCPECGKTGNAAIFANGCPGCGYAAGKERPAAKTAAVSVKPGRKDPLPSWLYILCAGALIVLAGAFIFAAYG